ncbi:MAG: hypothetical protein AAGB24_08870 [Bacteroidota bacterium]
MKRILLLFGLFCLGSTTVSAQFAGTPQAQKFSLPGQINTSQYNATRLSNLIFERFLDQKEKKNPINFEDIKGSPYSPAEFVSGDFYLYDEAPVTLRMRYNMYDDEVEVLENDGRITSFLKVDNTAFKIDGVTLRPYRIIEKGTQKRVNMIVLNDGDTKLLLRRNAVLIPAEKATNPNQMDRAAKFVANETYYLVKDNELPMEFTGKKKDLFTLFPEKASELKDYIKTNKLSLKNNGDLVQIFDFLNDNT